MPQASALTRYLLPLVRARLGVLPAAVVTEPVEVSPAEREALVADFEASPDANAAPAPRSGDIGLVASYFVDFGCDYGSGDPLRWSPTAVELVLLDWFPRKIILDPEDAPAVPDALRRWVRYADRKKGLPETSIAQTLAAVDSFEAGFLEAMTDDEATGPAKAIVQAMQANSVDLSDPSAVAAWIEQFNARPTSERESVLGDLLVNRPDFDRLATTDPAVAARREFACPPLTGRMNRIDVEYLDPSDPDDRTMLIAAEHPKMKAALRSGRTMRIGGEEVNPRLHLAIHEVVANQLWDGQPIETWEAAQRLHAQGHERHDVLHMLGAVVAGTVRQALRQDRPGEPGPAPAGPGPDLALKLRKELAALGRDEAPNAGASEPSAASTRSRPPNREEPIPIESRRRKPR